MTSEAPRDPETATRDCAERLATTWEALPRDHSRDLLHRHPDLFRALSYWVANYRLDQIEPVPWDAPLPHPSDEDRASWRDRWRRRD